MNAAGKGDGDRDKLYKKMAKNFKKQHVDGKHGKGKKVNHKGDFYNCYFKSVRISGTPKGSRIAGSIQGQIKGVARNVEYKMTGTQDHGNMGVWDFLVTVVRKPRVMGPSGKEEGKKVQPHHLDGELEIIEVKECKDDDGTVKTIKECKEEQGNVKNIRECKDEHGDVKKIKFTKYIDEDGNVKKIKVTKSNDKDGKMTKIKVLKYNDAYGNLYSASSSSSESEMLAGGGEEEKDIFSEGMWLIASALMNDVNRAHMRTIAGALMDTSFFPIPEDLSEDEDDHVSESSSSDSEDLSEDEDCHVSESSSSGIEDLGEEEDGHVSGLSSSETEDLSEDEDGHVSASSSSDTEWGNTISGAIMRGLSFFFKKK